ncbi:MAG: hypothetical protein JXR68_10255 [Bacteroidales bacterium]|nr:hypothetical protein [Bacteroidales bacterium]
MNLEFADLHHHSTLRPFAEYCIDKTSPKASIWHQEIPSSISPNGRAKNYTQSDFTSLVQGDVKMAFAAMYPIEQGWFNLFDILDLSDDKEFNDIIKDFDEKKLRIILNKKLQFIPNKNIRNKMIDYLVALIGHWVTSLPTERILQIMKSNYNYFNALIDELNFLKNQCVEKYDVTPKIPNGNDQLLTFLQEKNTLVVIPSIEGAASFVSGNATTIHDGKVDFDSLINNVLYVKKHYNVFFVTLSHHFYNGFNGHAQSIYAEGRMFIDQMFGKGNIITSHGWEVIKTLLSIDKQTDSGYRILIDTKHMSVPARIEYYNFIKDYNKLNPHDIIPIISSHSAFSGLNFIENLGQNFGEYSNYEVNIASQEVEAIYNSGGLIGINFDQNVLSKKPKNEQCDDSFSNDTKNWTPEDWAGLIIDNLLSMVQALDNNIDELNDNVWNIFTIGSDFDGFIDPLNSFATASKFPELKKTLIQVLNDKSLFKKYSFGLSSNKVVEKFMGQNLINFAKKHYHAKIDENQLVSNAKKSPEKHNDDFSQIKNS